MWMTRFFDMLFSLIAMLFLLPFMIPVMIGLLLTGEHYVFYFQPRIGYGRKEFLVYKFATMLKNSPNMKGGVLTQKNDPRILPMGSFLRKTKINELPQLMNIFLGDMSFVGPRPQARRHYELYSEEVKKEIDKLRPGLTGIGSIVFCDEETMLNEVIGDRDQFHDTVIAPYKGELELWYAKHRSLGVYFLLILLTALSQIAPRKKFYKNWFKDLPIAPERLQPFI
jgi:lipopolysaccharide/colanic/teichoic acid biosynthesis glycosyltransferase